PGVSLGEAVCQRAGAVGAVVVDHQHVDVRLGRAQATHDPLEVVGLVVGGNHHDHPVRWRRVGWFLGHWCPPDAWSVVAALLPRRYEARVRSRCPRTATTITRPGHTPIRTAGVTAVLRPTSSTRTPPVRAPREATTSASGDTTPDTPLTAATTTHRPVSRARRRLISNCWSICP